MRFTLGRGDVAGNVSTSAYNSWYRPTQTRSILGHYTTHAYEATFGQRESTEDHLGRVVEWTYYTDAGRRGYPKNTISHLGVVTTTEYNILGQPTRTFDSLGTVTTYAYTEAGVPWSALASITDTLGHTTEFEYDSRGLRTGTIDAMGRRSTAEYDAAGRLVAAVNPLDERVEYEHDAHGRLLVFRDELGYETAYEYDPAGRTLRVTNEDATYTTYAYDTSACGCAGSALPSNPTAMRTRNGEHFAYDYDVMGRLVEIAYPGASRTVTFAYTTHATENPYGALRRVRDTAFASGWAAGNWHFDYTYDAWGRRLSERFPDGEVVGQGYDAAGRVANVWFGSMGGFATTYAYDAEGRLEEVSNSHGRSVAYAYYGGAAGTASHRLHELTTGGGAVTEFDYDDAGRLGRYRVVPTSGSAHNASYDYRDDGTIAAIYAGWSVVPASFTGFAWDYAYDDAGRLTRERRAEYDGGSIVATALDQQYAYDAAGNRLARTGSGTGHEAMGAVGGHDMHNDMHQLEHYALGGLSHVRRAYDDAGNTTRHWDTAGTPAFDWNYTWSADNRLTYAQNAVTGGKKVRYVYDWQGRRLQRTDETYWWEQPRTRYYFHGLTPLAERYSERELDDLMGWAYVIWSTSRLNTLAPGQYGHVVVQRNGGTDRYLHYDHVGNVIAESSTSGTFTAQHEQDAFGRPVLSSASGGWSHNALHMTTKDYDADAGLFYFWQRWYDPKTGHFFSGAPKDRRYEHPFSLALQRPTFNIDYEGMLPQAIRTEASPETPLGDRFVYPSYDYWTCQDPNNPGNAQFRHALPATFLIVSLVDGVAASGGMPLDKVACLKEAATMNRIHCDTAGYSQCSSKFVTGWVPSFAPGSDTYLCMNNLTGSGAPGPWDCRGPMGIAKIIIHEAAHLCGYNHFRGPDGEPYNDGDWASFPYGPRPQNACPVQ